MSCENITVFVPIYPRVNGPFDIVCTKCWLFLPQKTWVNESETLNVANKRNYQVFSTLYELNV